LIRCRLGHLQGSDHLDAVVAGLWNGASPSCLDGRCRRVCVDAVGLAVKPTVLARRTKDLDHGLAVGSKEASQAGAVAARALDPKYDLGREVLRPPQQRGISSWVRVDLDIPEVAAELVLGCSEVRALVRVDSDGDAGWDVCDTG